MTLSSTVSPSSCSVLSLGTVSVDLLLYHLIAIVSTTVAMVTVKRDECVEIFKILRLRQPLEF